MLRSTVLATAALALAAAPAAHAAPKAGSYKGTSSAKYVQIGQTTLPTDKGTITFSVRGSEVRGLKLRGQLIQCGPPAEIPITVAKIKLSAAGKGKSTFTDPNVGPFKISITVSSSGKASGSIVGAGLCSKDYPVRFTAKRS